MKPRPPLWLCLLTLLSCAAPRGAHSPAPVSPRTGADQIGEAVVGVRLLFPSRIEALAAGLAFLPPRDQVCLEFPYETATYRQYWDRPARELFIAAVEAFRADLDRGPPQQSAAKAMRAYGRLKISVEWGAFSAMLNYAAQPQLDLGYTLIGETPYLTITQYAAESRGPNPDTRPQSGRIRLYLTREWAEALARRFAGDSPAPPAAGPAEN